MSMGKQVYSYKTALIILKIINRPKKEVRGCEHCTDPTQSYAFHMLNVTQHFGDNRTTFFREGPKLSNNLRSRLALRITIPSLLQCAASVLTKCESLYYFKVQR